MSSASSLSDKRDGSATTVEQPAGLLSDAEHGSLLRRIDKHFLPWVSLPSLLPSVEEKRQLSSSAVLDHLLHHAHRCRQYFECRSDEQRDGPLSAPSSPVRCLSFLSFSFRSLLPCRSLSAQQWAWCIACFYYSYGKRFLLLPDVGARQSNPFFTLLAGFLEPFSTFFIRLTTPSQWIGRIMLSWGIIMACMPAVTSYGGLVAARVLIGAAEAG